VLCCACDSQCLDGSATAACRLPLTFLPRPTSTVQRSTATIITAIVGSHHLTPKPASPNPNSLPLTHQLRQKHSHRQTLTQKKQVNFWRLDDGDKTMHRQSHIS